jgi:hypothetical protein
MTSGLANARPAYPPESGLQTHGISTLLPYETLACFLSAVEMAVFSHDFREPIRPAE